MFADINSLPRMRPKAVHNWSAINASNEPKPRYLGSRRMTTIYSSVSSVTSLSTVSVKTIS
ncbi:unnamed protein product [Medioppia subpectinata]|uniref:Uncharacterized protein n=1 Tax=Medioppia subpectinata TaxID=1979941 RepID=A0A7R9M0F7_9ACAR|nr:unnamed protein product [Medioppia subpectinata]CAG2123303.1 unnamed protein product [Medioppia subpectinata]